MTYLLITAHVTLLVCKDHLQKNKSLVSMIYAGLDKDPKKALNRILKVMFLSGYCDNPTIDNKFVYSTINSSRKNESGVM